MDWMGLEKIEKKFDLFGIQTHSISLNPHGLRANRTSPYMVYVHPSDLHYWYTAEWIGCRRWEFFFFFFERRDRIDRATYI
jgi:hypothetical protein